MTVSELLYISHRDRRIKKVTVLFFSGHSLFCRFSSATTSDMNVHYSDTYSETGTTWVDDWCADARNSFLVKVPYPYMYDTFNLYGLRNSFPHFQSALSRICNEHDSDRDADRLSQDRGSHHATPDQIEYLAERLYGMIHNRYLSTTPGLKSLRVKVKQRVYGTCRRVLCANQPLIPCGLSEQPGVATVRVYCPRCAEIYHVEDSLKACLFFHSPTCIHSP